MRSVIKLTVAFMALIGLVAGNAMAIEVTADANATFGQTTYPKGDKNYNATVKDGDWRTTTITDGDDATVSQLEAHGESNVIVSGGEGPITGRARLRMRDKNAADALRHEVKWMATDQLAIIMSGSGFGVSATAGKSHVATFRNPVGDKAVLMDTGYSAPTFQANFAVQEGMNVGLALLDGNSRTLIDITDKGEMVYVTTSKGGQTMIPYFQGSFGEISVNAYMATRSGKAAVTTEDCVNPTGDHETCTVVNKYEADIKMSYTGFGVGYDLGDGMNVGFDYATNTYDKDGIEKESAMGLSFKGMGVGVRYASFAPTTDGEAGPKTTNIDANYAIPAGNGSYGFGLRQVTVTPEVGDAATTQAVFLGAKTSL